MNAQELPWAPKSDVPRVCRTCSHFRRSDLLSADQCTIDGKTTTADSVCLRYNCCHLGEPRPVRAGFKTYCLCGAVFFGNVDGGFLAPLMEIFWKGHAGPGHGPTDQPTAARARRHADHQEVRR